MQTGGTPIWLRTRRGEDWGAQRRDLKGEGEEQLKHHVSATTTEIKHVSGKWSVFIYDDDDEKLADSEWSQLGFLFYCEKYH